MLKEYLVKEQQLIYPHISDLQNPGQVLQAFCAHTFLSTLTGRWNRWFMVRLIGLLLVISLKCTAQNLQAVETGPNSCAPIFFIQTSLHF